MLANYISMYSMYTLMTSLVPLCSWYSGTTHKDHYDLSCGQATTL